MPKVEILPVWAIGATNGAREAEIVVAKQDADPVKDHVAAMDWTHADALFFRWAGIRLVKAEAGQSRLELDVREHHRGGGGTAAVNGGIVAYLFDGALGAAVRSIWDTGVISQVTITLNIQYLRMIRAEHTVVCEAQVVRQGRLTVFVRGDVTDEAGEICSSCTGIYRLLRKP